MPASVDNAPQNPAPFVDQRPNGPGVSKIDPSDPAAPMYRLLAKMRSPMTLRDLMIHPVRTGYIGQEQPLTAADLPKSAAVKVEHHRARTARGARRRWTEDLAADAAGRRRNGDLAHADIGVELGGALRQFRCCDWLLLADITGADRMNHQVAQGHR